MVNGGISGNCRYNLLVSCCAKLAAKAKTIIKNRAIFLFIFLCKTKGFLS
jgi:hypothetical protein